MGHRGEEGARGIGPSRIGEIAGAHEAVPADARFALDALPALTARPDQINQFRQTILNLAVRGKLRPLFFLWALVVTYYLIKGYFLGGYRFTPDEFRSVVYLVIAALIALLGAFVQMFRKAR